MRLLTSLSELRLTAKTPHGEVPYWSTGSCRLCKPCHKKLNEPCAHPDIRTFSYEALGVNVSSMVHDIFGIDLLWYAKGSLPLYTCVVAGLLSNQMMLDDRIIAKIKEFR